MIVTIIEEGFKSDSLFFLNKKPNLLKKKKNVRNKTCYPALIQTIIANAYNNGLPLNCPTIIFFTITALIWVYLVISIWWTSQWLPCSLASIGKSIKDSASMSLLFFLFPKLLMQVVLGVKKNKDKKNIENFSYERLLVTVC